MAAQIPGELEKSPHGAGSVNKPASGTYGETAALDRLKRELPPMDPNAPSAAGPVAGSGPDPGVPFQGGDQGRPPGAPDGVPSALLSPSTTDTPVNTPLTGAGPPGSTGGGDARGQRVALLQALAASPEVSDETREWAQMLLEVVGVQ